VSATPSAATGPVARRGDGTAEPDGPTANVSARRREILATAAEIFARKGYVNATVREIADASGILAGSLYHHFESKEAMVDEILSTFLTDLVAEYEAVIAAGDSPEATLRNLVRTQFHGMTENQAAITVANNDSYYLQQIPRFAYLQQTGAHIERLWVGVLQRGIDEGAFRADTDPAVVWVFIKGAAWATVQYLSAGGHTTSDAIAGTYLDVLLDGVRPR
jgi:AcrR family transcriptional regulator